MPREIFYCIIIHITLFNCQSLQIELQLEKYEDSNQVDMVLSNYIETQNQMARTSRKELGRHDEKEAKFNYLKKLFESVYKFKKPTEKPRTSKSWIQKSWSAKGMPFNVLYTPNSKQQKILKAQKALSPVIEEKSTVYKDSLKKNMLRVFDSIQDNKKPLKAKEKILKKQFVPRKYYSLIPQLFVSYGW